MLSKQSEKLDGILKEINIYNTHFSNHVGVHAEELVRRGIIILQIFILLTILFV